MTAVLYASTTSAVEVYSDEKGGGRKVEGSGLGYLGGGDCARDIISSSSFDTCSFSSISSRTDDGPSLASSSVPDNVMAECSESLFDSS